MIHSKRNGSARSVWSSGMIPALGAGGPGFNPPNGPVLLPFSSLAKPCSGHFVCLLRSTSTTKFDVEIQVASLDIQHQVAGWSLPYGFDACRWKAVPQGKARNMKILCHLCTTGTHVQFQVMHSADR